MNNMRRIYKNIICWLISLVIIFTGLGIPAVTTFAAQQTFTANAMSPLFISDWQRFQDDLSLARQMGMDGISVDVWWGDVEKNGDNQFNWSYYDTVFSKIKAAGLKIVPIMSFHQCGGNVGDDYSSYLPSWIWTKYTGRQFQTITLGVNDLKYKSALGNYSGEYLQLWADDLVANEYIDFMNAFENRYGSLYANDIQEINISAGPSGELRYPSYNAHDPNSGYPTKGFLQCYSILAQNDFRKSMIEKYGSLQNINSAWKSSLTDINQITPPTDGDLFYKSGIQNPYYQSQYGKDLLEWYNGRLAGHGRNMMKYGIQAFDGQFSHIPLGIKIPGVHWQMESDTPRAAEVNAGLINADFSAQNGYGYNPILRMIKEFNGKVILHFTCLEMNNYSGNPTSAPKKLVGYVGDAARALGVEVKGENALAGGNDSSYFWENIESAITHHGYNGITILRLNDAVHGVSYNYYSNLIRNHKVTEQIAVKFTVQNATTVWGENIYVVGSLAQLGSWDPKLAVKLDATNYPTWSKTIANLPSDTSFEFKFIKKDASGKVTWESRGNRTYTTSGTDSEYSGIWNQ